MWMPILVFFYMGFEHSVVNMFLFPSGLLLGGDFSLGDYLVWNEIPTVIGNLVGGLTFVGLTLYATHGRTAPSRPRPAVDGPPAPLPEPAALEPTSSGRAGPRAGRRGGGPLTAPDDGEERDVLHHLRCAAALAPDDAAGRAGSPGSPGSAAPAVTARDAPAGTGPGHRRRDVVGGPGRRSSRAGPAGARTTGPRRRRQPR